MRTAGHLPLTLASWMRGRTYDAVIYRDGEDAHWDKNPQSYEIVKRQVTRDSMLTIELAAGGGQAISLFPVQE